MQKILQKCLWYVFYTGIFSIIINLLALVPILYMLNIMDRVLSNGSMATLGVLTLLVVALIAVGEFIENIQASLLNRFGITLHRLLGQPILKCILMLKQHNEQSRQGLEDVELLQNFITTKAVKALFDLPWIPFYVVILYLFHPVLALLAVIAIVVLFILAIWENFATKAPQLQAGKAGREASNFLNATLRNIEIINTLGMQADISRAWWHKSETHLDLKNKVANKIARINALTNFIRHLISTLALGCAIYLVVTENLSVGIMIASNMLLSRAMMPINSLIIAGKSFIDARGAYVRLNHLLAEQPEESKQINLTEPIGRLVVDQVSYAYTPDRNNLHKVSFALEPGETLAIIGASSSGKTTLAKLLVGYTKPTHGSIQLDHTEIFSWSKSGLGERIGYLPQDIQLFSGTVAENIARLASVQDNQANIIRAAKQARVHEMILKLPDGYDTEIGERGSKLSGGQRQRLGIARALFGQPKYLVLDEPNSSMDGQSELELLKMIKELKQQGVTVVLISHKPNLVEVTDKALILHEGQVVKFGASKDVMSQISLV